MVSTHLKTIISELGLLLQYVWNKEKDSNTGTSSAKRRDGELTLNFG